MSCNRENAYLNPYYDIFIEKGKIQNAIFLIRFALNKCRITLKGSIKKYTYNGIKAAVLQIILENHELCKYAKLSLHIHIIVYLNQNIA